MLEKEEKKKEFVEPELIKCEEPLDEVTMNECVSPFDCQVW